MTPERHEWPHGALETEGQNGHILAREECGTLASVQGAVAKHHGPGGYNLRASFHFIRVNGGTSVIKLCRKGGISLFSTRNCMLGARFPCPRQGRQGSVPRHALGLRPGRSCPLVLPGMDRAGIDRRESSRQRLGCSESSAGCSMQPQPSSESTSASTTV